MAGKSALNPLELTPAEPTPVDLRYKKIIMKPEEIDRLFIDVFLQFHARPPEQIVLDVDATDDPLHGKLEGGFFHGYYMNYCCPPLYIFCGESLLCARLRPSNIDASDSHPKVEITANQYLPFRKSMGNCAHGISDILGLSYQMRSKIESDEVSQLHENLQRFICAL